MADSCGFVDIQQCWILARAVWRLMT